MARAAEQIEHWSDTINAALPTIPDCCVGEVLVYASVGSTQDAAWRHRQATGVAVLASVQTAGRGRLGRKWDDGRADTLPVSFALPSAMDDVGLSARAGLGALDVCRLAAPDAELRIKWPNDIVVCDKAGQRKLAGVLVERRDGCAVVGVGINVFVPTAARGKGYHACSLDEVGGLTDRCALAIRLIGTLSRWLAADDKQVRTHWAEHDAMVGTERAFVVDHERIAGVVMRLDPLGSIEVGGRAISVQRARTETPGRD
jgi:BirA family biotin operon repressor/biotin-[acetyl-CoA-carboxylase] ligase